MEDVDLKLKLFGGRAIEATGYGNIDPLTVGEIIDAGYTEYMKALNIVTLTVRDFIEEPEDDIHILELLIKYGGAEIEKAFEDSMKLFLKGEVTIDKENIRAFVENDKGVITVISKENYYHIQEILKWQNYINNFEEKSLESRFDPADEEARKFREHQLAMAKKRDALKRKQSQNEDEEDEGIDFYDILSSISSKSFGVNELNVNDLTVFQVYRKFKRLEIIDQYDISIKSMLAGAKDVKLKHWSSKG